MPTCRARQLPSTCRAGIASANACSPFTSWVISITKAAAFSSYFHGHSTNWWIKDSDSIKSLCYHTPHTPRSSSTLFLTSLSVPLPFHCQSYISSSLIGPLLPHCRFPITSSSVPPSLHRQYPHRFDSLPHRFTAGPSPITSPPAPNFCTVNPLSLHCRSPI